MRGARDGQQALELVVQMRPDLIALDLVLPEASGIEVTWRLRRQGVATPVLALSNFNDVATVRSAFSAGANGYFVKSEDPNRLGAAVCDTAAGRPYWSPAVRRFLDGGATARAAGPPQVPPWIETSLERVNAVNRAQSLTPRELEVALHVAAGCSGRQIAGAMGLEPNTIQTYRQRAMDKMKARNAAHLAHLVTLAGSVLESPGSPEGGGETSG